VNGLMKCAGYIFLVFNIITSQLSAQVDKEQDPIALLINGTRTSNLGCGAHAIYLLLASKGTPEKLSDINSSIDQHDTGICTAYDIINYFKSRSMMSRLISCNYEDLLTSKESIILILKNINNGDIMHFTYVMHSKERELELVDPTIGAEPMPITKEWLGLRWDGYAILVKNP
jgi:hypothetical protein